MSCIPIGSNQKFIGISSNALTFLLIWLMPTGSLLVSFVPLLGTQIYAWWLCVYICSKMWCWKKLTCTKGRLFLCPDRTSSLSLGASPSISFGPIASCFPFSGIPGIQHSLTQEGCWLECVSWRQGWLRRIKEKGLLTWASHLLAIPTAWPGAIWNSLLYCDVAGWLNWLAGPGARLYGWFGFAPLS